MFLQTDLMKKQFKEYLKLSFTYIRNRYYSYLQLHILCLLDLFIFLCNRFFSPVSAYEINVCILHEKNRIEAQRPRIKY